MTKNEDPTPLACYCNHIDWQTVDQAIRDGARNLADLYDLCGAGTGPCGGSCRHNLQRRLKSVLEQAPEPSPPHEEPPAALVEAVSLFNRRYYWETHEVLEKVWLEEYGPHRLFYQGLIQAAASLYHVLNANPKGALKLAEDARTKLQAYLPVYYEIPLQSLVDTLGFYVQQCKDILAGYESGFDYDRLPVLTLGKEMVGSS